MAHRYYIEANNPDGAYSYGGVPLRDLEQEEYDALLPFQQTQIDASPFYRKTKPTDKKKQAEVQDAPVAPVVAQDTNEAPPAKGSGNGNGDKE